MEYTKLGPSDLTVSRICMGCMGFGDAAAGQHAWTVDEAATRDIVRRALELGVNFFDTAITYQGGTSEQYLGRALRDLADRDAVVVATKFPPRSPEALAAGVDGRAYVGRMLDQSLRNLGIDHVDLYILHGWDYHTPISELLAGLGDGVRAGKVRYIGISNCYAWQLVQANAIAAREGFPQFISVQNHYNLIFREEEREMVSYCRDGGVAMTPYSALAGGRLSKRPGETSRRLAEDQYAKLKYGGAEELDAPILRRVAEVADQRSVTMTEIALAWLLAHVTATVVGATRRSHIEGAVRAVALRLTPEETAFLEEPYRPHPLVGVMAQNTPGTAPGGAIWSTGSRQARP